MLFGHWLNQKTYLIRIKSDEAFAEVYKLIHQAGQQWLNKLGK